MVRLRVQKKFTLKDYAKVTAIKKQSRQDNEFLEGDIIDCDNDMATYLDGKNPLKESFVKIIEVIPEEEPKKEVKTIKRKSRKK